MPQWRAARHAAFSAGRGPHARLRHHGPRQSGARLALHARRLFRSNARRRDRKLRRRGDPGGRGFARRRDGARSRRHQAAVRPQPPRPRARHLRSAAVLQRAGAARLGAGRDDAAAAAADAHCGPDHSRRVLSALPPGHHLRRAGSGGIPLCAGDAHPARHADPRRRFQSRDGRRARRQHQAPLHAGVRPLRRACRLRRRDAGADPYRADRHGREHSDPRLRGDHHRRHRLDPRRLRRRDHRRPHRYARPRLSARHAAPHAQHQRRADAGAGTVLDVDLRAYGGDPGVSAGRIVPGGEPMSAPLDPPVLEKTAPGSWLTPRTAFTALLLAVLALVPIYAILTGDTFAMTLFTRVLILALGAVSLNLIMGYGGMVSFGHAAYLGIGGYAVGILAKEGIASGFVQWPVAVVASALYALAVGALSLRTRGVYFIMITLAFAQMIY